MYLSTSRLASGSHYHNLFVCIDGYCPLHYFHVTIMRTLTNKNRIPVEELKKEFLTYQESGKAYC